MDPHFIQKRLEGSISGQLLLQHLVVSSTVISATTMVQFPRLKSAEDQHENHADYVYNTRTRSPKGNFYMLQKAGEDIYTTFVSVPVGNDGGDKVFARVTKWTVNRYYFVSSFIRTDLLKYFLINIIIFIITIYFHQSGSNNICLD